MQVAINIVSVQNADTLPAKSANNRTCHHTLEILKNDNVDRHSPKNVFEQVINLQNGVFRRSSPRPLQPAIMQRGIQPRRQQIENGEGRRCLRRAIHPDALRKGVSIAFSLQFASSLQDDGMDLTFAGKSSEHVNAAEL